MASSVVIDSDALLDPITEHNPVGDDIREDPKPDSIYQKIKQSRTSARAEERNNLYDQENNNALQHWKDVNKLAPEILKKHSKDLEILSWLIESQVRINGFTGLRDSFKLTKELIKRYWDALYPTPDEDGIITRVAPLAGLNGEGAEGVLLAPIRNIAITDCNDADAFSLWQYQQSLDVQKITDPNTRKETIDKNGYSMDNIESAVNKSSETFYLNLRDDIKSCINEFREITKLFEQHCAANEVPPSSKIFSVLEQCLGAVNHLAKDKFPISVDESESLNQNNDSQSSQQNSGPIGSRESAFKQLHSISDFFLKTEPHSPVSYLLAKAVNWGNMPLNELIDELIPDNSSRKYFSSLTGVKVNEKK